ncbi:hypothetical protein [Streptomyces atroolivaceus]|uniref:hypothetical protein n=1 Tax=Streptomyces atroolivaceus TaxID=66869 RepID=UPI002023BCBE|nr:hypothetical protein [Streptomyces atroolivaceus]
MRDRWGNASLQNPRKISEALIPGTAKNVWQWAACRINIWHGQRTEPTSSVET